jgi:UDP-N-acetylglucosamine acyltransferase
MNIHPTAIIEDGAELGVRVSVGPYAVIRKDVKIGDGTSVDTHAVIEGRATIGENCRIGIGAVIGNPPQDLKYAGEDTEVVIGDNTTIREYVTINKGTTDRQRTQIGSNCLLMSYVHVAHDCLVGNEVILANCATLAGHLTIEDQVIVGGMTPIHQFVRVGKMAILGGGSKIVKDIPPFSKVAGNPSRIYGLNTIGLQRKGYSKEERAKLKKAYKIIFRSKLMTVKAIDKIAAESYFESPSVKHMVDFIAGSTRGVIRN